MATTTNYSWTTPNDTDLVTNGALAIRTLGSAIDTTVFNNAAAAIPKSLIDAEGDLIVGDAADTVQRLAIGSNGNVLTVDTAVDGKIKWAAASGWSPNLTLLNAGGTALTGATTITVNVSSFDSYHIRVVGASSVNASSFFYFRLNADTGSNYGHAGVGLTGSAVTGYFQDTATSIELATMGAAASNTVGTQLNIIGGKTTGLKSINWTAVASGTTTNASYSGTGYYYGTAAITSVSLISSTGNFDAGTIYVYGG